MNACIVFQSDISLVQCYLLVDNTLMCNKNIWSKSKIKIGVYGAPVHPMAVGWYYFDTLIM